MNNPFLILLLLLMIVSSVFCNTAEAKIYRCLNRIGETVYTNIPNEEKCKELSFSPDSYQRFSSSSSSFHIHNNTYDSWIRSTADRYGVDYALIKAIISIESGFNHQAVSRKGARGLMQLMPQTAEELQVRNPFDPIQNIDGGTRYFRKMLDNFNGDLSLSLAAYNAGPTLVERIGSIPAIPETREYVQKVLRMYELYKKQH